MKKLSMKHSVCAAVFAVMGLSVAGAVMAATGGSQNLTINLTVPVGAAPSDFDATFVAGPNSAPQHPSGGSWTHTTSLSAQTTAPGASFTAGGNVAIFSQNNVLNSVDMYLAGTSQPAATFGADAVPLTVVASKEFTAAAQTTLNTTSQVLPLGASGGPNFFNLPGSTSLASATIAYDYLQIAGTVPTDATQQGTGPVVVTVAGTW